jgi:hypothetical protein
MKKVFEITKYDLIGKVLYTSKERPDVECRESNGLKRFYDSSGLLTISHLWEYTTIPKVNAVSADEKFMPYFADVTEDLPGSVKLKPKTFKNCQLMTEKHGGYLQFWHPKTEQVLRIAMNSHYYTPVK